MSSNNSDNVGTPTTQETTTDTTSQETTPTTTTAASSERLLGHVKWFKGGFGFVTNFDTKEDVFVHHTGVTTSVECWKLLYPGEYVDFSLGSTDDGKSQAVNITGVRGGPLRCETLALLRQERDNYNQTQDQDGGDQNDSRDNRDSRDSRRRGGRGNDSRGGGRNYDRGSRGNSVRGYQRRRNDSRDDERDSRQSNSRRSNSRQSNSRR